MYVDVWNRSELFTNLKSVQVFLCLITMIKLIYVNWQVLYISAETLEMY